MSGNINPYLIHVLTQRYAPKESICYNNFSSWQSKFKKWCLKKCIVLQRNFRQSPKKTNQKILGFKEKVLEFCKENCVCQRKFTK